ncbi:hypothetical protein Aperf_G00000050792 [Anoplocephala perfoliata]
MMPTQGNNDQSRPITQEPSMIHAAPVPVTKQPIALLVYPNTADENIPVSPQHIFILPSCNLLLEGNRSPPVATGQNRPPVLMSSVNHIGITEVLPPSLKGLECLNGVGKLWIYQKVELFESE